MQIRKNEFFNIILIENRMRTVEIRELNVKFTLPS